MCCQDLTCSRTLPLICQKMVVLPVNCRRDVLNGSSPFPDPAVVEGRMRTTCAIPKIDCTSDHFPACRPHPVVPRLRPQLLKPSFSQRHAAISRTKATTPLSASCVVRQKAPSRLEWTSHSYRPSVCKAIDRLICPESAKHNPQ